MGHLILTYLNVQASIAYMVDLDESHVFGHGFNKGVCRGKYGSPCPHYQKGVEQSGILGRIANTIDDETCGLCGCPLKNLSALKAPPENCPRLKGHKE
ncbi:MAG: hypothetical protein ABEI86_14410 [Halobacteriaceae archaeon]